MEIVHVQVRDVGTPAKRIPSTTAGLASGYQRTSITTSGISAVANADGYMLVEVATLPWYSPIPLAEPYVDIQSDLETLARDKLAEGYRAMAAENSQLAEEFLPIAPEEWPEWDG